MDGLTFLIIIKTRLITHSLTMEADVPQQFTEATTALGTQHIDRVFLLGRNHVTVEWTQNWIKLSCGTPIALCRSGGSLLVGATTHRGYFMVPAWNQACLYGPGDDGTVKLLKTCPNRYTEQSYMESLDPAKFGVTAETPLSAYGQNHLAEMESARDHQMKIARTMFLWALTQSTPDFAARPVLECIEDYPEWEASPQKKQRDAHLTRIADLEKAISQWGALGEAEMMHQLHETAGWSSHDVPTPPTARTEWTLRGGGLNLTGFNVVKYSHLSLYNRKHSPHAFEMCGQAMKIGPYARLNSVLCGGKGCELCRTSIPIKKITFLWPVLNEDGTHGVLPIEM